jgi:hypothetical protein
MAPTAAVPRFYVGNRRDGSRLLSSALVITGPTRPDALVFRWPGGRETRVAVPSDAREIFVSSDSTTAQIVPSP